MSGKKRNPTQVVCTTMTKMLYFFFPFPVLFMGVVVFLATCWYVLWDGRLRLVAGDSLRPYHPSMLYAYLALTLQGGVVQVR